MTTTTRPDASDAARNTVNDWAPVVPIELTAIQPSPHNPRTRFDEQALDELAQSLATDGLLEPIVIRETERVAGYQRYEIIAGERRWRAAQRAGLTELPARILAGIDDHTALRLALIENLQRRDLDPLEEAAGYRQLNRVIGLTQAQIATAVNRSQPSVAKAIGLLDLPERTQQLIRDGRLTVGHGAALARYKAFPAAVEIMAAYAAEHATTTKEIEKHVIDSATIVEVGAGAYLDYRYNSIKETHCTQCPFGAYLDTDTWHQICLKTDHLALLAAQAEADEEERAHQRVQQAIAAAQTEHATTTDEDERMHPQTADAAPLPHLRDLEYHAYQRVERSDKPDGCTPTCACRGRAIDYEDQPVAVCMDPDRYKSLQKQEQKDANRLLRQELDALSARIDETIGGLDTLGSREAALLAQKACTGAPITVIRQTWKAIAPTIPIPMDKWHREDRENFYKPLGVLSPLQLVKFALLVILGGEIKERRDEPTFHSDTPLTNWYMRGRTAYTVRTRASEITKIEADA